MKRHLFLFLLFLIPSTGCRNNKEQNILIFHAGSLSVPVKKLNEAFEKANPGVRILSEAAGSLASARKVTELGKPCDIVLSADYFVIDRMLIPEHASWNIRFATNEMVIAFRQESKNAALINATNWPDIILDDKVIYGRSDPDSDPCGYRTIFTFQLTGRYFGREGIVDSLLAKDRDYIRPKEVDLVALMQTGVIDYMFQYKSVAVQHGLHYIELPDEINLSDISLINNYNEASFMVPGPEPGSRVEVRGDFISYSGTVLDKAPNRELALRYFKFLLGEEGRKIIEESGQKPLVPALAGQSGEIPELLLPFVTDTLTSVPYNE